MRAFDRWGALTRDEQRLTMSSALAIAVAVLALRLFGVARTLGMAQRSVKSKTKTVIGEVVAAVNRAGRYVPGATCLSRSLALTWMLRRSGVAAAVRIGVKTAGQFEAHAWVECDGVAVENIPPGYAAILPR